MEIFIIGLVLFLGLHSVRIFAEGWRTRTIARIGALPWKGLYSVLSIAAFVLLLFGAFLVWAILDFKAARGRDKAAGTSYPALGATRTAIAVVLGLVAYVVFTLWLHTLLIGVRP